MSLDGATSVNIGRRGINQRRLVGVWALFLGVVLAGIFIATDVPLILRSLVFIPFFFGFLGVIQASRRTCVFLGLKGKQNLDALPEDVVDPRTRDVLRFRSMNILLSSALLAALATCLTMVIHLGA